MLCCLYRPSAPFPVSFLLYLATGRLPLQYSGGSLEAESRILRQAMTSTRHRPEPRQEISMGRGRISQRIPRLAAPRSVLRLGFAIASSAHIRRPLASFVNRLSVIALLFNYVRPFVHHVTSSDNSPRRMSTTLSTRIKLLALFALAAVPSVEAQYGYPYGYNNRRRRSGWRNIYLVAILIRESGVAFVAGFRRIDGDVV